MERDIDEGEHERSIVKLVEEFSEQREKEIRRLYAEQRQAYEKTAKITTYLPVLLHKIVRERLAIQTQS